MCEALPEAPPGGPLRLRGAEPHCVVAACRAVGEPAGSAASRCARPGRTHVLAAGGATSSSTFPAVSRLPRVQRTARQSAKRDPHITDEGPALREARALARGHEARAQPALGSPSPPGPRLHALLLSHIVP